MWILAPQTKRTILNIKMNIDLNIKIFNFQLLHSYFIVSLLNFIVIVAETIEKKFDKVQSCSANKKKLNENYKLFTSRFVCKL